MYTVCLPPPQVSDSLSDAACHVSTFFRAVQRQLSQFAPVGNTGRGPRERNAGGGGPAGNTGGGPRERNAGGGGPVGNTGGGPRERNTVGGNPVGHNTGGGIQVAWPALQAERPADVSAAAWSGLFEFVVWKASLLLGAREVVPFLVEFCDPGRFASLSVRA